MIDRTSALEIYQIFKSLQLVESDDTARLMHLCSNPTNLLISIPSTRIYDNVLIKSAAIDYCLWIHDENRKNWFSRFRWATKKRAMRHGIIHIEKEDDVALD